MTDLLNERAHGAIVVLIVLFSSVADLVNGILYVFLNMNLSFGILYRAMWVILLLPFFLHKKNWVLRDYTILIFATFCFFNFIWVTNSFYYNPGKEVYVFARILFAYFILGYFIFANSTYEGIIYKRLHYLCIGITIISLSIIFSFFTGLGIETYGTYSFGVKSFYTAQNDIGLSILISLPFVLYLFYTKKNLLYLFLFVSAVLGLGFLGTRTGVFGSIFCFMLFLGYFFLFSEKVKWKVKYKVIYTLFALVIMATAVGAIIYAFTEYPFFAYKAQELLSGDFRGNLTEAASESFFNRKDFYHVFGEGVNQYNHKIAVFMHKNELIFEGGKFAENNLFDFYGSYGFILGTLMILLPVILLVMSIYNVLKNNSILNFACFVSISLFIGHGFLAGHALNSAIVANYITVTYVLIIFESKRLWHLRTSTSP